MILLIGTDIDRVTTHFESFLKERNVNYIFFNQRLLFNNKIKLFSNYLTIDEQEYFYKDFSGVLNRASCVDYNNISNQALRDSYKNDHMLRYIISYRLKNVLNLSRYSISNDSKLFQLHLVSNVIKHIRLPDSIVMKNLDIEKYLYKHSDHKRHVIKSLSSVRSIAKEFEANRDIFKLTKSSEPVLFQQLLEGINIRVHVIDSYIFAVKIFSDSLDYRYENNIKKFEEVSIPKEIKEECLAISKHLNLRFVGIDLLLTDKDEYYIFEANPSPGYSYYEKETNSKFISEKLLEVLCR